MLSINEPVPDFLAETADGSSFRLSDFKNKKNVVLFFYPKAFSSGCTKQACQFRDVYDELSNLNCEIIGVSYDAANRNRDFKTAHRLPYHLISNNDKSIARLFGVTRFGGFLPFVKRVTFVIDTGGIIRNVIHHEFNINKHIEQARLTLQNIMGKNSTE